MSVTAKKYFLSHRNFKSKIPIPPHCFALRSKAVGGDKIGINSDVTPVFALRSKATGPKGKIVPSIARPILEDWSRVTRSQHGSTLASFLFVLTFLLAGTACVMTQMISEKTSLMQTNAVDASSYLAFAAVDKAIEDVMEKLRNYQDPLAQDFPVTLTLFDVNPDVNIVAAYDLSIYQQDPNCDPTIATCAPRQWTITNPDSSTSSANLYQIHVTAYDARYPDIKSEIWQAVEIHVNSTAQFEYLNDWGLHMTSQTTKTIDGRIHGNGDFYTNCVNCNLTFDGLRLTTAGRFYNRDMDNSEPDSSGTVFIRNRNISNIADPNYYAEVYDKINDVVYDHTVDADPLSPPAHTWDTTTINTRFGGTLEDSSFGVQPVKIADKDVLFAYLETQADNKGLKITCNDPCANIATDFHVFSSGNDVTQLLTVTNTVITQAGFWNPKSGANTIVVQIDIKKLRELNYLPANHLIYVERGDSAAAATGVRLASAGLLGEPLTVAAELPVFIKGDFNTGLDPDIEYTTPLNNEAGPLVQPAAVIAESVYFMSNGWKDVLNPVKIHKRVANCGKDGLCQYNMAIVAGYQGDDIGQGYGSPGGGSVMEDWGGSPKRKTRKIVGAQILAYPVWISTAEKYGPGCNEIPCTDPLYQAYREAANEIFLYDSWRFNNLNTLPPFVPIYYSAVKQGFATKK